MDIGKIVSLTEELTREAENIKRLGPIVRKTKKTLKELSACLNDLDSAITELGVENEVHEGTTDESSTDDVHVSRGRIATVRQIIKAHAPITTKDVIEEYRKFGHLDNLGVDEVKGEEQAVRYALNSLKSRNEIIKQGDQFAGVWKPTDKFKG